MNPKNTSWLALNGPAVFVGCLEIIVGLSGLLTPERVIAEYGYFPVSAFLWLGGYVLSGVMIVAGLATRRSDVEVGGILLLLAANLLSVITTVMRTGLPGAGRTILITLTLLLTMGARLHALVRGGTFVVPPWTRG